LGLDYGRKRIGVAVSDPLGMTAQPVTTIDARNITGAMQQLNTLVDDYQVQCIVLGMPLTLRGKKGAAANAVIHFAGMLKKQTELPVVFWDERLTSVQAERSMRHGNRKPSREKAKVDQIAAVLLLQNYLDYSHQNQTLDREEGG
jgi:putative Holliday junction resolvase